MMTLETIQKLKAQYQTTELNILREYCQHLFLSSLYQKREASRLLFKGGTALRILYRSPRFSEDLDFSSSLSITTLENLLEENLVEIERSGIPIHWREAKKTSGGYLAIVAFRLFSFVVEIQIEISKRSQREIPSQTDLVDSDFVPSYPITHLAIETLVDEKIQATLTRAKPRDFFDIYFILRANLLPVSTKKKLPLILKKLEQSRLNFSKELKVFLPVNQHAIIKNFQDVLRRELHRHGGG